MDLPRPVTTQDVYLHDIATSLRAMSGRNVHLLRSMVPDEGTVELREPATSDTLTCACGRTCKTPGGLAKHQTACEAA